MNGRDRDRVRIVRLGTGITRKGTGITGIRTGITRHRDY